MPPWMSNGDFGRVFVWKNKVGKSYFALSQAGQEESIVIGRSKNVEIWAHAIGEQERNK